LNDLSFSFLILILIGTSFGIVFSNTLSFGAWASGDWAILGADMILIRRSKAPKITKTAHNLLLVETAVMNLDFMRRLLYQEQVTKDKGDLIASIA
jgi:hypothetical protein